MTEHELIVGNDEICQLLGWETNKAYVYKVPNTFPHEKEADTGWIELGTQAIGFHRDWNMLIGAYNRALLILNNLTETQKKLLQEDKAFFAKFGIKNVFGVSDVNWQINITSSWIKFVDFCKWYNSIKLITNK